MSCDFSERQRLERWLGGLEGLSEAELRDAPTVLVYQWDQRKQGSCARAEVAPARSLRRRTIFDKIGYYMVRRPPTGASRA